MMQESPVPGFLLRLNSKENPGRRGRRRGSAQILSQAGAAEFFIHHR
jgi:hypothetical protein